MLLQNPRSYRIMLVTCRLLPNPLDRCQKADYQWRWCDKRPKNTFYWKFLSAYKLSRAASKLLYRYEWNKANIAFYIHTSVLLCVLWRLYPLKFNYFRLSLSLTHTPLPKLVKSLKRLEHRHPNLEACRLKIRLMVQRISPVARSIHAAEGNGYLTTAGWGNKERERRWTPPSQQTGPEKSWVSNTSPFLHTTLKSKITSKQSNKHQNQNNTWLGNDLSLSVYTMTNLHWNYLNQPRWIIYI